MTDANSWKLRSVRAFSGLYVEVSVYRHVEGFNPENCAFTVNCITLQSLSSSTMAQLEIKRAMTELFGNDRMRLASCVTPDEDQARVVASIMAAS